MKKLEQNKPVLRSMGECSFDKTTSTRTKVKPLVVGAMRVPRGGKTWRKVNRGLTQALLDEPATARWGSALGYKLAADHDRNVVSRLVALVVVCDNESNGLRARRRIGPLERRGADPRVGAGDHHGNRGK